MTEPQIPKNDREWLAKHWARLRAANEAVMVEDARKVLEDNRHIVNEHHKAMGVTSNDPPEADDMIVGDVTTNYHMAAAPAPQAAEHPKQAGMSPLAKALAVGLAAAGLGAGIGVPLALLNRTSPVLVQPADFTDTDTDTQYNLRIYRGDGQ